MSTVTISHFSGPSCEKISRRPRALQWKLTDRLKDMDFADDLCQLPPVSKFKIYERRTSYPRQTRRVVNRINSRGN